MKQIKWIVIICATILTVACTTIYRSPKVAISPSQQVAVLPFVNNTETLQAGDRAQAMVASLLQTNPQVKVITYHRAKQCDQLLQCQNQQSALKNAKRWASIKGASYAFTGVVNEWRYKVGLDGEPAVSLTLSLIDLKTDRVIWSTVASKTGGSRSGLGITAQNLIGEALTNVYWR